MIGIPDDPLIRCAERTGYAPWKNPYGPICPVCGGECETIYKDINGDIFGCDCCVKQQDAYETEECYKG